MMLKKLLLGTSVLFLAACGNQNQAAVVGVDHSQHAETSNGNSQGMSAGRLNDSPRHQEWVEVKNGNKNVYTWVVYPERETPAPVVILIHENKGLNDWARGMADQIAEAGYIAVAPDLLSEFDDMHNRTSDFPNEDAARTALGMLVPDNVMSDLQAVADWAKTIPSSNGKLASAGFCWGGGQSFEFASRSDDLSMAMVFYGTGPTDPVAYSKIDVPVVGFYGGADERVNATIDGSEKAMQAAGKTFDYEIYKGAGHAFMRVGEDPSGKPEDVTARNDAWERMKTKLAELE